MVTVVERINQTRRMRTFLRRLFARLKQNITNNEQKRCKNKV